MNFLRSNLLAAAIAIGLLGSRTWSASLTTHERPNVVLIVTDDHGCGDFGSAGNPLIETPHLDAFAAASASVENFYVSPLCSPTRASLMTGRYNYRTRVVDTALGRCLMEPEEVTIAELLSQAGYSTGIFGKWHLGDNYPMRPMDQGFQECLILRGGGLAQPTDPPENKNRYTDPILFHNGKQVATTGYCTDVEFDAAIKFIEQSKEGGRNFFAYIPTNAPHYPFHDAPPALVEHYRKKDFTAIRTDGGPGEAGQDNNETLAHVAAMITNIDENVGRLVKRLEELGIAENTLVIFLVDNGPSTRRYVRGFRGIKWSVYEGGIRSPLWLKWPGKLPARKIESPVAAHIDILPTILAACGVQPPEAIRMDGRSLLPLLQSDHPDWPARSIVIQAHRGDVPMRYNNFMVRDGRWKLVHAGEYLPDVEGKTPAYELFDLQQDPGEQTNVAGAHPDIVSRLETAYNAWFDDVSSTRPDNYQPPRVVLGTAHENPMVLTRHSWRGKDWIGDVVGRWAIEVDRPGEFDVILQFEPREASETAVLKIGEKEWQLGVDPGAGTCSFPTVMLPAGPTWLEARLEGGSQPRGANFVTIHHRNQ